MDAQAQPNQATERAAQLLRTATDELTRKAHIHYIIPEEREDEARELCLLLVCDAAQMGISHVRSPIRPTPELASDILECLSQSFEDEFERHFLRR